MLRDYFLQNWPIILILLAFVITLKITVFLDRKTIHRMYVLIAEVFLLSVVVFVEFQISNLAVLSTLRIILMAIRYSATPVLIAQVIYTLVQKTHWFIFIPSVVLALINFISIFPGIAFRIDENNVFHRGPLGFLPFIIAGLYCVALVFLLFKRCNKHAEEILPIVYLCISFAASLLFPFLFGSDFSEIFCTTIAIALFVYYVFMILQLTKKDPLTGLLNRQAYYAEVSNTPEGINALVSIDMNGLKTINDTQGHAAGDEALSTLALCFIRALKRRQSGYRIGGDEFVIVCRRNSQSDVEHLVERIRKNVAGTEYSCSIGYVYTAEGTDSIDDLLKQSDAMMYSEKERYYIESGKTRR